jgi:acyl-CoA reductase-like NAD-dependent aldehyde dehydrogenase
MQDEIFGPIISLLKAETREHMLEVANMSQYTLAASIWTKSLSAAHSMARSLNAGIIWINAHHLNDPSSPWGGWDASGLGRENGQTAFKDNLRQNSIVVNLEERQVGWFTNKLARYG